MKTKFGCWEYNAEACSLWYAKGRYMVDLDRCGTSAEVLDWIFQVNAHGWSAACVADLVEAIRYILHPQKYLCSNGIERGPIDVAATIKEKHNGK
jgi:hypothetical protein